MNKTYISTALLCLATTAQADVVHLENTIVNDNLCVGSQCVDGESFGGFDTIKLDGAGIGILFNDTGGTSSNDWRIQANDTNEDSFFITDVTGGTSPFKIMGTAPSNSFFISSFGEIGIGTIFPDADLHIGGGSVGNIQLDGAGSTSWQLIVGGVGIGITDQDSLNDVFFIENGAPREAMRIENSGEIGLGTSNPEGKLHTKGDGVQLAYFESGDGDAVQVRFRTDSENRRFLAVDNANNVKTQMQFRDNSIVFLGETVAQEWLNVSAAGITTAGPTCNPGPCDATFDPDAFEVPSIEEHATYMWENQHLWAVGPTKPNQPVNLTEKTGGIIHELEVAHIYIEQLHDRLEAQETNRSVLEAQMAEQDRQLDLVLSRLAVLEARP